MKYKGNIFGFVSSDGSIYNILFEDKSTYAWRSTVYAKINNEKIQLIYNWNGDPYEVNLTEQKKDYFIGDILKSNKVCGKVYFWQYTSKLGIMLTGEYVEEGLKSDCFIELQKIK
ncbi:MAG TPA: hypothetical protein PLU73_02715 [Bacteroidia bacterium]|nr:hypothetical protein [Bacteroidia bacterium]